MSVQNHEFEPLPPYADPRAVLREALPSLRPAEEISVTGSAEKYMNVRVGDEWPPFHRDVTPYMVEPTDMIASRLYRGLVFCGPSQSGKTQMLQSALAYTVASNPGRVALFQMTRDAAGEFEREKIAPMIRNSPALKERQGRGRGADNIHQKLFSGGTELTLDWPTVTKLSSRSIRWTLGTDYDHFPENIGGEGDAFTMMRARTRSYMSRGMAAVESSPGAPITDESWKPDSPHACPPVGYGVLSIYPDGTRGRWYWECPHCDELFEPLFRRLHWPDGLDPKEAGEAAEMECPHCHAMVGHEYKVKLNASGIWLHETGDGRVVPIDHPDVRKTDILSYWLNGTAAAFSTWAELVTQELEARQAFEKTGDEKKLISAANTGRGEPYLPRAAADENEVTLQALKDKAQDVETPKGVAPSWTRYITVSADTQKTLFDVGVVAWGEDGRHQIIDRFELHTPPKDAPGRKDRVLKPFEIAGDWKVLDHLAEHVWPVEGENYGLRPVALGVDMHGGGSTTENAYKFYRARRKAGQGHLWYLTRGIGGDKPDRVWLKAPERARGRRRVASDIKILNMATDRLKDAVASSLRLTEAAQYKCEISGWMEEHHLIEATAERRTGKGWEKRPGMVRNETLDHLVQARAQHLIIRADKIDWAAPPEWAAGYAGNSFAVVETETEESSTPRKASPRCRVHQINYLQR